MSLSNKPRWLDEQEEIKNLLMVFIDRLNRKSAEKRKHPPGITVNKKYTPSLFYGGDKADIQWALMKVLCHDYHIFSIRLSTKRNSFEPEYIGARLTFNLDAEPELRSWLNRPREIGPLTEWQSAVDKIAAQIPGSIEQLRARRISIVGMCSEQILAGFLKIGGFLDASLTVRQLSACCFWGLSKFLDGREELVCVLYPELTIVPRPLLVNVYLPRVVKGVLFIENQDSYASAIRGVPTGVEDLALVYSSGFMGSASRIRSRNGALLHLHGEGVSTWSDALEAWWFAELSQAWPVYFWGDLDFSGMMILRSIKERFEQIEAWPLGYQEMLRLLESDRGHRPDNAKKQDQIDPGVTGSLFADEVLLPAIRQTGAFIDQEVMVQLS